MENQSTFAPSLEQKTASPLSIAATKKASSVIFTDGLISSDQLSTYTKRGKAQVVELSGTPDAVINTITETLGNYEGSLKSIHFLTHGDSANGIGLGTTRLNADTVDSYAPFIQSWGESLRKNGDIFFYSCQAAKTDEMQQALKKISSLAKADVAASINDTGSEDWGGDWDLEFTVGRINHESLEVENYEGILADRDSLPNYAVFNKATGRGFLARITNHGGGTTSNPTTHSPAVSFDDLGYWHGYVPEGVADFDGNGTADVIWRHATNGTTTIKLSNGGQKTYNVGMDWKLAGVGDVTNDGHADLIWHHNTGPVYAWQMNNMNIVNASIKISNGPAESTGWSLEGIGDMDNNGKNDLFWRHTNGTASIWSMNGTTVVTHIIPPLNADGQNLANKVVGMNEARTVYNRNTSQQYFDYSDKLLVHGNDPLHGPRVYAIQTTYSPGRNGYVDTVYPNTQSTQQYGTYPIGSWYGTPWSSSEFSPSNQLVFAS